MQLTRENSSTDDHWPSLAWKSGISACKLIFKKNTHQKLQLLSWGVICWTVAHNFGVHGKYNPRMDVRRKLHKWHSSFSACWKMQGGKWTKECDGLAESENWCNYMLLFFFPNVISIIVYLLSFYIKMEIYILNGWFRKCLTKISASTRSPAPSPFALLITQFLSFAQVEQMARDTVHVC